MDTLKFAAERQSTTGTTALASTEDGTLADIYKAEANTHHPSQVAKGLSTDMEASLEMNELSKEAINRGREENV